jgi:hypothetical protein
LQCSNYLFIMELYDGVLSLIRGAACVSR